MTNIPRICAQNKQHSFLISKEDQLFYDRIAAVFGHKKYTIPVPTLCPDCRQQRRSAFRNERKLYNRRCDLTGKEIISMYSADKPFRVYDQKEWWSDQWDPLQYGRDFDFNRPFFEQFRELQKEVPRVSILNTNSENSEYTNYTANNKNAYLIFSNSYGHNENCYYGTCLSKCTSCLDAINISDCQYCVDVSDCKNCYRLVSSRNCTDCSESYFLSDCKRSKNCIACKGLRDKQYCILNKQYSKGEYFKLMEQLKLYTYTGFSKARNFFDAFDQRTPHISTHQYTCDDSTGDYLENAKKCRSCFDTSDSQDGAYLQYSVNGNYSCFDSSYSGGSTQCYETHSMVSGNHCLFINIAWWGTQNLYYCELCFNNTTDCFGCIGLRHKQYCILNKQYTKEEYEILVPKIIEHMQKSGEWGEFFPMSLSPFAYNETIAQDFFPLKRDQVLQRGIMWKEEQESSKYYGPSIEIADDIGGTPADITNQILSCSSCHRRYKIIVHELRFYQMMNLPLPRQCFDCRHLKRLELRNPRKLWDRTCMKCSTPIQTSYAPDRKEIVYCEKCYQESVY